MNINLNITSIQVSQVIENVISTWMSSDYLTRDWPKIEATVSYDSKDDILLMTKYLTFVNLYQWHLEDLCRIPQSSLVQIGSFKKQIDQSNLRRIKTINAINHQFQDDLKKSKVFSTEAPVAIESLGGAIDRLSILKIKYHFMLKAQSNKHEYVSQQILDFCDCFDKLIKDIVKGELRMQFYETLKLFFQ